MKKIFTFIATVMVAVCASAQETVDYTIDWTQESGWAMWAPDEILNENCITVTADGLTVNNAKERTNYWDMQMHIANNIGLEVGTTYTVKVVAKTVEGNANVHFALGSWGEGVQGDATITNDGFKEYTFSGDAVTGSGSFLMAQFGKYVGTIIFKSVTVSHIPAASDIDDYMVKVDLSEAKENSWDSQLLINIPQALTVGKTYEIKLSVKGSVAAESIPGDGQKPQFGSLIEDTKSSNKDQWGNSADLQYTGIFSIGTNWAEVSLGETNGNFPFNRLILQIGHYQGTLYVDNVKFIEKESGEVIIEDFKDGIAGKADKRSYHNHVTVTKAESDCPGTATGITNITSTTDNASMFNIAGQRVNSAKGLVIKNGKKCIVK